MYKKDNVEQPEFKDFFLPFGGKLDKNNRWIKRAKNIPWEMVEEFYAEIFSKTKNTGAPAINARIKVSLVDM